MTSKARSSTAIALSIHDHRRDITNYVYVYPVYSRRAQGISIGINLHPNNACNWACEYCQVANLIRGKAPTVDLPQLKTELLDIIHHCQSDQIATTDGDRRIMDLAFSGNGEPTQSPQFAEALALVRQIRDQRLPDALIRIITNGSGCRQADVQNALQQLGQSGNEIWFKVDRILPENMLAVNGTVIHEALLSRRVLATCRYNTVWLQTCIYGYHTANGVVIAHADQAEIAAYGRFIDTLCGHIAGVHLYGLARKSQQNAQTVQLPIEAFAPWQDILQDRNLAYTLNV